MHDLCSGWGDRLLAAQASISGAYDLMFTSPPYFDKERYSLDEGQSYLRYPKYAKWVREFLGPMLLQAAVRTGGHIIVNIDNITSEDREPNSLRRKIHPICDDMNDFLSRLPGSEYLGHMGLPMTVRPGKGFQTVIRT